MKYILDHCGQNPAPGTCLTIRCGPRLTDCVKHVALLARVPPAELARNYLAHFIIADLVHFCDRGEGATAQDIANEISLFGPASGATLIEGLQPYIAWHLGEQMPRDRILPLLARLGHNER